MNTTHIEKAVTALKSPEGFLYAGLPKFRALFGRDSIISSLELLGYDDSIALSTLKALAERQGKSFNPATLEEPGKIIHEFQHDTAVLKNRLRDVPWLEGGINYFSVDSTPLFLILASEMVDMGKQPLEDTLMRSAADAFLWIVHYGIKGKYLSYMKAAKGAGLQSQSWKDGIGAVLEILKDPVSIVGVQGYAYEGLTRGADLLMESGMRSELGDEIETAREMAATIKDSIDNDFYIDETGYYAMAIDGDGVAEQAVSSDPGHLLHSGMLSREKERSLVDRLFEDDLLTDYGIRCMSSGSRHFDEKAYQRGSVWPHDNFMIWMGLRSRGYSRESDELRGRVKDALDTIDSFPEYYGVTRKGELIPNRNMRIPACDPQAWTVGAYLDSGRQ